jgi:hypothetical protein
MSSLGLMNWKLQPWFFTHRPEKFKHTQHNGVFIQMSNHLLPLQLKSTKLDIAVIQNNPETYK